MYTQSNPFRTAQENICMLSVSAREHERAEIQKQIDEFLKNGGKIKVLSPNESYIPDVSEKEKAILKTLYLRSNAKPASDFPASLRKEIAMLKNKRLVWSGDGLLKITSLGRILAQKLFPIVTPELWSNNA